MTFNDPRRKTSFDRPLLALCLAVSTALGCLPAESPSSSRPPRAEQWYQRAVGEYRRVALDEAHDSARQALDLAPQDPEVKLLAARVALARLELDEVLRLLKGVSGSAASSVRGRALWYKGDIERAADELEQLLADPEVDDPWAKQITALARSGAGRKPFDVSISEGQVVAVEMSRVPAGAHPIYILPVEIDGEQALTLIATGTAEVMIDSSSRRGPSWVSMRFGRKLEVRDVPALTQDLSSLSRQLGAPIKALIGANLLRHVNATLDYRGRQFVARTYSPPPPPVASRVDVFYLRGGGMVIGSALGSGEGKASPLMVDTSMGYPLALDGAGWKKIGIEPGVLKAGGQDIRGAAIPAVKLGAFTLPQIPAISGPSFEKLERELEVDLDGALGAGLLGSFRLTFAEGGRVIWFEQAPPVPKAPPVVLPEIDDQLGDLPLPPAGEEKAP